MKHPPLTIKQKKHIRIALNLLVTTISIRMDVQKTDALKLKYKKRIARLIKLTQRFK